MANPSTVIATEAFASYVVGELITDAMEITSILAGPYWNSVTPLSLGAGGTNELLLVGVQVALTNQPLRLGGAAFNAAPVALDYSIDGGNTWAPVDGYALTEGNWTGFGPTYATAQSGSIIVRDHAHTSVVSSAATFTVTPTPSVNITAGTLTLGDGSQIIGLGAGLAISTGAGSIGLLEIDYQMRASDFGAFPNQAEGYPEGGFWLAYSGRIELAPSANLSVNTVGNLAQVLFMLDML